jgi:L-arabinose isomerase
MKPFAGLEVWFVTGGQDLYGEAALQQVAEHASKIATALDAMSEISLRIVNKPVVKSPESIRAICLEANATDACVGIIAWMHTFSPARMWIGGLRALDKPLLHLHTQFNRDLPWATIDMDFMNVNQSAHGDREFAHLLTRLGQARKTVVGHWQDPAVAQRIGSWARAAAAWRDAHHLRVARFGDNMRDVAATEGDKVAAQMELGVAVNGYGISDLAAAIERVPEKTVDELVASYDREYAVVAELGPLGARRGELRSAARIEAGLRALIDEGGFRAFTDTFEDLDGLAQLPGIGVQRLMAEGIGFGAEGDWKTAVMVRLVKVMASGLPGGTSFMEDYTYHLDPSAPKILGAHMLEVCPTITAERPSCEIHPLSIGGKSDPVRLVFTATPGPAVVASLVDIGDRLRIVANQIEVVPPDAPLPRLPVARAVWQPRPDLATAATAWLIAGGSHHTVLTQAIGPEPLADFAEMAGIEFLLIDSSTTVTAFKNEVRWNHAYYRLAARS